ncbi:MAG: hypothetical protein DRN20_05220, partial [Thermoplasmata archaeon]
MKVIPSISIMDGEVVVVEGDRYKVLRDEHGVLSLQTILHILDENYDTIHVLDINGIERMEPQLGIIESMREEFDGEVWVDAGVRKAEEAYDVLMAGADVVVLGTKRLRSWKEAARLAEDTDNFAVSVDIYRGRVVGQDLSRDSDYVAGIEGGGGVAEGVHAQDYFFMRELISKYVSTSPRAIILAFMDGRMDFEALRTASAVCEGKVPLYIVTDELVSEHADAQILSIR